MTTYKLEHTDFEGEKTTLIKELRGDNAWEDNLEDALLIISDFLRAIGYNFDRLEVYNTYNKEPLKKLKGCVKSKNCLYNDGENYGSTLTEDLKEMREEDDFIGIGDECEECGFNPACEDEDCTTCSNPCNMCKFGHK